VAQNKSCGRREERLHDGSAPNPSVRKARPQFGSSASAAPSHQPHSAARKRGSQISCVLPHPQIAVAGASCLCLQDSSSAAAASSSVMEASCVVRIDAVGGIHLLYSE
jgi:hypothetical protein